MKKDCYHVKFRPADGARKGWSAEVWLEKGRPVVLRSKILRQEGGEVIEEELTLLEIRTGVDVAAEDLVWKPPVEAKPMEHYHSGPLPR